MAKVLITRISSFGDVAMLVPVVFSVAAEYPQDRFVILTRKAFAPLFENLGFNVSAKIFDVKKHGGFFGIFKLLKGISNCGYTHIADMHDVLRSKTIRYYMTLLGKDIASIKKGRKDKQQMIASKNTRKTLPLTTERFMKVFQELGFSADMVFDSFFEFRDRSLYPLRTIVKEKQGKWVGIAPFSKHNEKIYPLDKMENIVSELAKDESITVFLFGSGKDEYTTLQRWEEKYPQTINVSGKVNLVNELLLISYLEVMISMDSANMHLASLVKTPAISIWGATHPSLGFYGFNQDINNAIQTQIDCRPCSVYGEIPCSRGDYACLNRIKESSILERIDIILKNSKQEECNITSDNNTDIIEKKIVEKDCESLQVMEIEKKSDFSENPLL